MTVYNPDLVREYSICQRRGHAAALTGGTKECLTECGYFTCRHCGTQYRTVSKTVLEERNTPQEVLSQAN